MLGGILTRLARVQFTVGYAAVLLAISSAILMLGPHAHDVIVQHASTNLHNLARGHLGTLLGSALVVDAGPLYFWLPFLTCLLALAFLVPLAAGAYDLSIGAVMSRFDRSHASPICAIGTPRAAATCSTASTMSKSAVA